MSTLSPTRGTVVELAEPLRVARSRRARLRARVEARMGAATILLEQANVHAARAHDAALDAARRGDSSGLSRAITGAARYGAVIGEQRAIHQACDERLAALVEAEDASLPRTLAQAVDAALTACDVADAHRDPAVAAELADALAALSRAQGLTRRSPADWPAPVDVDGDGEAER
jgi:hypothetical protein